MFFYIYIYIAGKQLQWPFSQWPFSRYIARCPAGFANGDGSDQVESFLEQNCCMGMGVASRFETKFEINMCIYMNRHAWLHFPAAVSCIRFVVLKLTKGWNINIYIYIFKGYNLPNIYIYIYIIWPQPTIHSSVPLQALRTGHMVKAEQSSPMKGKNHASPRVASSCLYPECTLQHIQFYIAFTRSE